MRAQPPKRKRRAATSDPAPSRTAATTQPIGSNSTAAAGDLDLDRQAVDAVDASIWTALFAGEFRLAVRCDRCGRWLTSGRSKAARRGPRCAKNGAAS